jgi:hypothetical protein
MTQAIEALSMLAYVWRRTRDPEEVPRISSQTTV